MKTIKIINTVLFLMILLKGINIYSQEKKNFLVDKDKINLFTINGIGIMDLNEPGISFEKLKKLGNPEKIIFEESFVEKTWVYEYSGMKLIYVNVNGYPELLEMDISDLNTEFKICFNGKSINEKTSLKELSISNEKLSGKNIDSKTVRSNKFDGGTIFMEIFLRDDSDGIKRINLKNKII